MANKIKHSFYNPIWFYQMNPQQLEQYVSRHMDLYPFHETIEDWEAKKLWAQPWQNSDEICLQFQAEYAPLRIKLIDGWEQVYDTINAVPKQQNSIVPALRVYEFNIPLTNYGEGYRFLQLEAGQDADGKPLETWISNPLHILKNHKNTLYLEYNHLPFKGTFIFATGIRPKVRIKGRLVLETLSANNTLFEDDELSLRLSDSKSFEVYELTIGHTGSKGPSGIPDIHAKQLNKILGCKETFLDGRQYTRAEPNLQVISEKNQPLKAWSIKMRDTENKDTLTYENNEVNLGPDAFIMSVEGKGFGISDSGQSQIQDLQ